MALRFSPLDVDATIWFTAEASRVETFPGSDRVRTWFDRGPTRDYPLTGFDHQEDLSVEFASAPRLTGEAGNALNGRATIAFPVGSYLKGATRGWTGNWGTPEPDTPWSFFSPFGGVPREQTYWYWNQGTNYRYLNKALPPDENHGFVLARVFPPSIPSSDASWLEEPTGYRYENVLPAPRRPVIWSPRVYNDASSYPGLRIWLWDSASPLSAGTLAFHGDAVAAVEPYNYPSPLPEYEIVDYEVPFDRFGKWTLFEWKTTSEVVNGTPYRFCYLYLNGRQASKVICPSSVRGPGESPDYDLAFDFSLFGEPQGEGQWNDIRASKASGNVAEVVLCRRALSDDEAARTRAWLCRRWGLEELLVGQPYASLPEIPGEDAQLPWAFPGVRPSSRTYVPGAYANSSFASVGGVEQRVRHSRAPLAGDRLSLSYSGLSEADVARFLSHYGSTLGGFKTFGLRPETLVNLGVVARHLNRARSRGEYAPRGAGWAYASEPVVRNQLRDVNELSIELELLAEPFQIEIEAIEGVWSLASQMGLSVDRSLGDSEAVVSIDTDYDLLYRAFFGDPAVSVVSDATLRVDRAMSGTATVEFSNPSILMTVYFDGEPATVEVSTDSELVYESSALTAVWDFDGSLNYVYEGSSYGPTQIVGEPTFDVAIKYAGISSLYTDGDYNVPTAEFLEYELPQAYGLADFCVQARLRIPASLFAAEGYVTPIMFGSEFSIDFDGSVPEFRLYLPGAVGAAALPAAADVWHHVAAYRVDGVFYLAVDGFVSSGVTYAFDFDGGAESLRLLVGDWIGDGDYSYFGWVDRLIVEFGSSPFGADDFVPPA